MLCDTAGLKQQKQRNPYFFLDFFFGKKPKSSYPALLYRSSRTFLCSFTPSKLSNSDISDKTISRIASSCLTVCLRKLMVHIIHHRQQHHLKVQVPNSCQLVVKVCGYSVETIASATVLILIRLGFLRAVFPGEMGQFDSPLYFKKNLSNIKID